MITIALTVSVLCLLLAMAMIVDFRRSRSTLLARITGLAPGTVTELRSKSRRLQKLAPGLANKIDSQLIELVEMIAVILNSGESMFAAVERVARISNSELSMEFAGMLRGVELGGRLDAELSALCQRVPTNSVREFSNKLSLAMARGTPLSNSLVSLARSLRAKHSAAVLRRAGANETKMLIPIVAIICPVTIVFALYPSSQFLSLGFS